MSDSTPPFDRRSASAREAWLGAFFLLLGGAFAVGASQHPIGHARDMGPGYFPLCLGVLLGVFGAVMLIRSLPHVDWTRWRPLAKALRTSRLWPIGLALLAFGFAVEDAGLFLSTVGLVVATSATGQRFRWREATGWGLVVAAFCSLLFVTLLGMQLPVWPSYFG